MISATFRSRSKWSAVERRSCDGARSKFPLESCDLILQFDNPIGQFVRQILDTGGLANGLSRLAQSVRSHVGRSVPDAHGYASVTGYMPSVTTGYVPRGVR